MVWHDRSAAANMVEKNYYPSCAWWVCCPSCFPASSATGAFSILTAALLVFCWSIGSIRDIKHNKNWSRRAFSRKCGVLLQGECDDQLPSMSSDTPCWGLFFVYVRTPPRQIWEISTAHPSAVVAGSRIEPNRADPPKCALEEAQPILSLSGRLPRALHPSSWRPLSKNTGLVCSIGPM